MTSSIPPKRKHSNDYKEIKLTPVIQNADSSFVVITYWWGSGNTNKNLQKPCPSDIENAATKGKTMAVRKQGKKFDEMIDDFIDNMKSRRVNYLVAEYPMFAVKGGYQNAINYKPYFIEEALRACYPRSVLYIDGDMKINQYPRILDTPGIDFAGRAWGIDLDGWDPDNPCYDPYVFETSGGTLFFGQTLFGYQLLDMWQEGMRKHVGKAEDRVISLIVNNKKLIKDMNMIQLPIEYLWLTLLYENASLGFDLKKHRPHPIISHPFCLTSEEAAIELSDELLKKMKNRIPNKYSYYVDGQVICNRTDDIIYEYITYKDKRTSNQHVDYNKWSTRVEAFKTVKYDNKYGEFNNIAKNNLAMMRSVKRVSKENTVCVSLDQYENAHIISKDMLLPTILSYLKNKQSVIYLPPKRNYLSKSIDSICRKVDQSYQLIARNKNDSDKHFKKGYMLSLDEQYPIYFSADNKVLYHLLVMSENLKKVGQHFNSSSTFISRIRCNWL
jgi:hypothetical protein